MTFLLVHGQEVRSYDKSYTSSQPPLGLRTLEQVLLMGLVSFGMIQPLRLVCQQVSFTAENEDPL